MDITSSNSLPRKNPIKLILILLFVILIVGVTAFWWRENGMKDTDQPTESDQTVQEKPTGAFKSISGEIKEVNSAVMKVRTAWGQDYQVNLTNSTVVLPIKPPSRTITATAEARTDYKILKEGQFVNVATTVDLSKTTAIDSRQITNVEVYIND